MQQDSANETPQAPETQPADVRDQLHQENISKVGQPRDASDGGAAPSSHFGAVEDDMTGESDQQVVTPPMTGPYNIVEKDDPQVKNADVDPGEEIIGGA